MGTQSYLQLKGVQNLPLLSDGVYIWSTKFSLWGRTMYDIIIYWSGVCIMLGQIHDIDVHNVIRTHLSPDAHDVHWGNVPKWYTASCFPLMTLTLLSLYCLFVYVVWLEIILGKLLLLL